MQCLSLSGLRWAKKTGIFILGTLTLMTVEIDRLQTDRQIIDRQIDYRQLDSQTDGQMDRWTDGQIDRYIDTEMIPRTKDMFLEILFYDRNQVDWKIVWG